MPIQGNNTTWPTPGDYDWALQHRHSTFRDPDIQYGDLKEIAGRPAHLNGGGSKYVCVYKVGEWVVRCFAAQPPNVSPPAGIEQRYRSISAYLNSSQKELPFLVKHTWVEHGLNVNGKDFPYLKIPYISENRPLGDLLSDHAQEKDFRMITGMLANQWLRIAQQFEARQVAHGDLDLTNILVCGSLPTLSLHLIDFDGMYVPDLAHSGLGVADNGHAHFQPVEPRVRTFGPTMDRFSVLIIYLSLCALAKNPHLWENCEADETHLLLGSRDFERLGLSKNFIRLRQESNNSELQKCLDELQASIMQGRMPHSLSDILHRPQYAPMQDVVEPARPSQQYTGRSLVIPVEETDSTEEAQPRITVPPPPTSPPPVTTQDNPSPSSPSLPPTTPVFPDSPALPDPPRRKGGFLTFLLILLLLAIIGAVIWWYYSTTRQQPTRAFLVLPLLLLPTSFSLFFDLA